MTDRRSFLRLTAGAAGLAALGLARWGEAAEEISPATDRLEILVLGGTGFIGPHQVEYALARGHRVTLFNRGNRSGLFDDRVEELVGDRDLAATDGLDALSGDRTWDVVIDNSATLPLWVRRSSELLRGRCRRYLFVSSVASFAMDEGGHFAENAPLAHFGDPDTEEIDWSQYGPMKAECERIVHEVFGDGATIVRPVYVIGPGDRSDRFTYWAERLTRGGDVLGPASPDAAVQFVDVRDLAPWMIRLLEDDVPGDFNGGDTPWSRQGMLWGIRATTDAECRFHFPSAELAGELQWSAPMLAWGDASMTFGTEGARRTGLQCRPLAESAVDTRAWWRAQSEDRRSAARGWPSDEFEREALRRMGIG